jgi:Fic family protein
LSAIGHYNFVRIHPFADGNGRVARLFGNILLLRGSFTPAVIYPKNKEEYIEALLHGHQKQNITPMIEFLAERLLETQMELIGAATTANSKQ